MEEENEVFIKAFNNGYILEKYEPALLAKVLKNLNLTTDYLQGLSEGQKEYQQERIRVELDKLSQIRNQPKKQERDLGRE